MIVGIVAWNGVARTSDAVLWAVLAMVPFTLGFALGVKLRRTYAPNKPPFGS